ncbi:unnamed protein product [Albugo candida]|nr:unnamed protein product [Albugo candida]|eukprot:CCI47983.1 unnamed protein product [Albugo candida]
MKQTQATLGVCYDPYQRTGYTEDSVKKDFKQIAQSFGYVRTFSVITGTVNLIECAATAGLKMNVGVQMNSEEDIHRDIKAICDAVPQYSATIHTVSVGNENMKLETPTISADKMLGYIGQVRRCVSGTGIIVTTTQRIGDWLNYNEVKQVANKVDVIVANIYPFFTESPESSIKRLEIQIEQIRNVYGNKTVQIGETGWASAGEIAYGNTPSLKSLAQYFQDWVRKFQREEMISYFFIMYDNIRSYTGKDHELHFGLCTKDGKPKVTLPKRASAVVQNLGTKRINAQPLPGIQRPSQRLSTLPKQTPAPKPAPIPSPASAPKAAPIPAPVSKPAPILPQAPASKPAPILPQAPASKPAPILPQALAPKPAPIPAPAFKPAPIPAPASKPAPIPAPVSKPAPILPQAPASKPAPILPQAPKLPPAPASKPVPTPLQGPFIPQSLNVPHAPSTGWIPGRPEKTDKYTADDAKKPLVMSEAANIHSPSNVIPEPQSLRTHC